MTLPSKTGRFTLGRNPDCDVVIADPSVSRRHAELTVEAAGQVVLRDCGSTQGTYRLGAGGQWLKIIKERVQATDTIRLGKVQFTIGEILWPDGPPPARQPAPSASLLRCACGAIKPSRGVCHVCGQS